MKTVYFLLFMLVCFSCSNFLDETDPSNFTADNYFTTAEQAESGVNSIYQDLRMYAESDYGGNPYFMTEFQTGLAGTMVSQNVNINNIRLLTNNADNRYSESWWNYSYRAIANANLVIASIPAIQMDEAQKNQYLGEAYFLRAYNYFNLVRLFGSIPLIQVPVNASSDELYPNQATVADICNAIVSDLKLAETSGLDWLNEDGRVSLGAVKSLLANVYLTMAGYPLELGSEYYAMAAAKAKEVIDQDEFSLFSTYDALHRPETENAGEHIFMIQYQTGIVENPFQSLYLPYNRDISYYSTETGSIFPTNEFILSYEAGDRRIEEEQFYFTKYTSNANRNQTVNLGGYYIYKFFDTAANLSTAASGLNYPLIRYAEVLLIYAEAQNEADGAPSTEAYTCLNQIRTRANLDPLGGLSQGEFRTAVWTERYHELAFENKTWFDMARTRKALNLVTGNYDEYVGHKFSYGPTLKERELLFPIPTSEINNNKNLTQNKDY